MPKKSRNSGYKRSNSIRLDIIQFGNLVYLREDSLVEEVRFLVHKRHVDLEFEKHKIRSALQTNKNIGF